MPGVHTLLDSLTNVVAFCLSAGDSFLPTPAAYDDLFYKLIETGSVLALFRDAYNLKAPSGTATENGISSHSVDILISVSTHYHDLLESQKSRGKRRVDPKDVHEIIKNGYETLSIQAKDDLDHTVAWKESERKAELKRIGRCVVEDARKVIRER